MAKKRIQTILDNAVMTEQGLRFNGFFLRPVVEQCDGCERILEHESGRYCSSYPDPNQKWARGACNFATHVRGSITKNGQVKINPLKASKRAARGR
ncbi:MAG: PxxKW family cysteine-rich protein [Thermodesulfobacteriota bacterium]|nr:PxxKW family cysteine-rich protein [Thermodesulfobacteriota bacterium]